MTKLSQCNRCKLNKGIHCEYYSPIDDTPCIGFDYSADVDEENHPSNKSFVVILITALIVALKFCWPLIRNLFF